MSTPSGAQLNSASINDRSTKDLLIEAALACFSVRGYADVGIRDITARAGLSAAVINQHFGSKERLFEEVLESILQPEILTRAGRETFGEFITDYLLKDPASIHNPLAIFMMASGDAKARSIAARILREHFSIPLAQWFGPEEGQARAARFMLLSAGLTLYSRLYPLETFVPDPDPAVRQWLVDQFQALVLD